MRFVPLQPMPCILYCCSIKLFDIFWDLLSAPNHIFVWFTLSTKSPWIEYPLFQLAMTLRWADHCYSLVVVFNVILKLWLIGIERFHTVNLKLKCVLQSCGSSNSSNRDNVFLTAANSQFRCHSPFNVGHSKVFFFSSIFWRITCLLWLSQLVRGGREFALVFMPLSSW